MLIIEYIRLLDLTQAPLIDIEMRRVKGTLIIYWGLKLPI
jgi:hypothetical protein